MSEPGSWAEALTELDSALAELTLLRRQVDELRSQLYDAKARAEWR